MSQDEYNASVPNRIQAARFLLTMLAYFRGRRIDESDSVLDIGCGPEVLLKPLWANGKNIPKSLTGIDNNSEYGSQDFWREPNRKFIQTGFLEWPPDEKFSVIWSSMSAHWITGPNKDGVEKSHRFFQIIREALEDDGYFACIAPAGKNFYPLISKLIVAAFSKLKDTFSDVSEYFKHRDKYYHFWNSISEITNYGSNADLHLCGIYKTRDWQQVKTTEIGKIWKSANEKLYEEGVDTEKVAQEIDEILIRAIGNNPEAVECTSKELGTSIFKSNKKHHYLLPYIDSFVFVFKKSKIISDRSIANNPNIKSDLLMHTLDNIRNMEGKASLVKNIEYRPSDTKDSIKKQLNNTALQVFTDIVCDPHLINKLIYAGRSYPGEKKQIADVENSAFEISHKWRKKIIDDENIKRRKELFKPAIGLREEEASKRGFFGIALCVENRENLANSFRFINTPGKNTPEKNEKRIAYIGIASPPVPNFDLEPPADAEAYLRIIRGMQPEDIFSVFVADDDAFRIIVPESENDPCAIKHFHYFRWQASYYQPNLFILSHTAAKTPPVSEGGGKNFTAFLSIALDKSAQASEQLTNLDITELAHCLKAISLLEDIAYQRKSSYERLFKEDRETFRALYNLPQETIRLLKETYIPPVSLESGENKTVGQIENFAKTIISRIPKADLHVHVGSCVSPEFLVAASIIKLLRHRLGSPEISVIPETIKKINSFFKRKKGIIFEPPISIKESTPITWNEDIAEISKEIREFVEEQISYAESIKNSTDYRKFRSALHDVLSLDDHWDEHRLKAELRKKNNISLLLFALMYGQINGEKPTTNLSKEDILRIVIIVLATTYQDEDALAKLSILGQDVLPWFNDTMDIDKATWMELRCEFYTDEGHFAIRTFRNNGWKLNNCKKFTTPISIRLKESNRDYLTVAPKDFKEDPITFLLASGTRANNLKDYLEGCELSGAEHLQHPFLMHLYAQQLLLQFENQGIMYAELRAAATGYTTEHFSFSDVCSCIQTAFSQAQKMVNSYPPYKKRNYWLWETPFAFNDPNRKKRVFDDTDENNEPKTALKFKPEGTLFPTKINIVLTGKRHKPIRQIIQEAAAGVVFHHHEETSKPRPEGKHKQKIYDKEAWEKYKENMNSCHFVGFDLAGQEDGYPPEAYRKEFEQLSKMHIPITVHCGENAPAKFVESAVLDLGAKRLGHGLSVAADQKLMDRIREYRVCVELCPISNFQTNHLLPHEEDEGIKKPGRQYPLRKLLENGNAICLNTDNPIISHTNMVKECFQASYAYGGKGLSLWDLLSIIRMGFYYAFLQSPERKTIIRYAEKKILNIFEEDDVLTFLYSLKQE